MIGDFTSGFTEAGTYVIITFDAAAKDVPWLMKYAQYPYDGGHVFTNYLRLMLRVATDQVQNTPGLGFYPSIGYAARYPIYTNDNVNALPPCEKPYLENIGLVRIGRANPPIFYNAYYPW